MTMMLTVTWKWTIKNGDSNSNVKMMNAEEDDSNSNVKMNQNNDTSNSNVQIMNKGW